MMASKRTLADQDPDYESIPIHVQQKKLRLLEQDVKEATIRKIEKIFRTQFAQEIANKEQEIEEITQQLNQARSLMDRLRANIVMKYYATGEQTINESPSETHPVSTVHPTVKKYLGKAPATQNVSHISPNKLHAVSSLSSSSQNPKHIITNSDVKISSEQGDESPEKSSDSVSRAARLKKKCRIVVGNVSKYIPAGRREDNDQATHKWMVYVRGSKERPKIDDIVKKVIFFLHPSYRPNDLVEIGHPPFHLTRRGWGEFPIRVQLHFHDNRNKPVDIIHNLKLDKTLTGLQTLGAETLVDIWMFKPEDKFKSTFNLLNVDANETASPVTSSSKPSLPLNNSKDAAKSSGVVFPEPDTLADEGSNLALVKQKFESIPYFDTADLLVANNQPAVGETLIFEPPANDVEKEVVVSTDRGDEELNTKSSKSNLNGSCTADVIDLTNTSTIVANASSTVLTKVASSGMISSVKQSCISSSIPQVSTAISSEVAADIVSSKSHRGGAIFTGQNTKPNTSQGSSETPNLTFSSQMSLSSIKLPSALTQCTATATNAKSNATSIGSNTLNEGDVAQGVANGLRTFVKCIDSKGQIILVPCDSLLKSQTSVSGISNPTKLVASSWASTTNPSKPVSSIKHSLIKPPLVKSTLAAQAVMNGAQLPSAVSATKLVSTPMSSYLVRMLPSRHGGPGQLIFIPNMTTASSKVTVPQLASNSNLAQSILQRTEGISGNSTVGQRNSQITSKDQKPLIRVTDIGSDDNINAGAKVWRRDALGELERAIETIRLEHYETMDLLLRKMAKLHPLVTNSPDRSCYPYCAPSVHTFHSWNIGKQRACEWTRALAIKQAIIRVIQNHNGVKKQSKWSEKDVWSVRRIMTWCKRHGYTPLKIDYTNSSAPSASVQDISNLATKSEPKDLIERLEKQHSEIQNKNRLQETEEEEIDIITVDEDKSLFRKIKSESPCKSSRDSMIYLPFFSRAAQFIKEKAQEVGVNIKPLEIIPCVSAPVIEEIILAACKEFVGDIVRNGLSEAFERLGGKRCPDTIETTDIVKGILKLPFSDLLTNESLGVPLTQEIIRSHLEPL